MIQSAFVCVHEHIARNPVARAIAKARMIEAIRVFQLRLYELKDGELCGDDVEACTKALTVCCLAMELSGHAGHPSIGVMRGAMSALVQCSERRNRWRSSDAVAIDTGLQHMVDLYPQLSPIAVRDAWDHIRRLEARIAAGR